MAAGESPALRVLHCPDVVGGHAPELSRAERGLGVRSWSIALLPSPYGYAVDETLCRSGERAYRLELRRLQLLWRALRHFDVVHFNFGASILPCPGPFSPAQRAASRLRHRLLIAYQSLVCMRDLPLLKAAGKAVFVTYQGDDARQADFCRASFDIHFAHEVGADYYPEGSDDWKRRTIAKFAAYADGMYALNPDLLHVLPGKARFVPYANVNLDDWKPVMSAPVRSAPLRVAHAPSNRLAKGTRYLLLAVEQLKAAGIEIDLILVENLARSQARELYEQADLVVDQLLAGWYGGLAVEAMALGKPVVAYIRDDDLRFVPKPMRDELPVINASPRTIGDVLGTIAATQRERLPELGAKCRAFVERWHDPRRVAMTLIADYQRAVARR